jgi:hypothetical protein
MSGKFRIDFSSTSREKRPAVSFKIREYFVSYLEQKLFEKAGIIVNGNWNIRLSILFVAEGPAYKSSDIVLVKGAKVVKAEKVKIYEMLIPLKIVVEQGDILNNTIFVLQDALTILFTSIYKKITKEMMYELWRNIDMNYLKSLPYPAPIKDQKYVGDIIRDDGSIYHI